MKLNNIKAYVMVLSSGLVILATIILVALQWGNESNFSMYGRSMTTNTARLMIYSGIGGVVFALVTVVMYRGARQIQRSRAAAKSAQKSEVTS